MDQARRFIAKYGIILCISVIGSVAIGLFIRWIIRDLLPHGAKSYTRGISLACIGTYNILVWHFGARWRSAISMRKSQIAEEVPVCLKCGYQLTGLTPEIRNCPECGKKISDEASWLLAAPREPAPD
ncbi:MAG: hypothetical protein IT435_07745 [Phycisphaerales bacterium]|nr:hypothetical protein [Phycisphaerales bacterium]